MKSFVTFLFLAVISIGAFATDDCRRLNRENFLNLNNRLYAEYSKVDPDQIVTENKKAKWIEGDPNNSKALFVAHGYMGTPSEMMYLARPFIEAGWTVVGFLIPGHGSSAKVSNAFDNERWQKEFAKQFQLVTSCFTEVKAIGFSTGGLLLHDYFTHHPNIKNVSSLHFVSPYFIQKIGRYLDYTIANIFIHEIPVDLAYDLTHFPDLEVMTVNRKNYNQVIPAQTALQVRDLGIKVYKQAKLTKPLTIPVQLFLTEGDWTVDTNATKKVIFANYKNVDLHWYKGSEPHHLMVPEVSAVASDLQHVIFSSTY